MNAAFNKITLADLLVERFLLTSEYDAREDEIRHLRYGAERDNPGTHLRIKKLEEIQEQKAIVISALHAQINEIQKSELNTQPPKALL
jgi:hypothetical protein